MGVGIKLNQWMMYLLMSYWCLISVVIVNLAQKIDKTAVQWMIYRVVTYSIITIIKLLPHQSSKISTIVYIF